MVGGLLVINFTRSFISFAALLVNVTIRILDGSICFSFIANWKSNKTILQAKEWFQTINNSPVTFNKEEKEIIVCPSFTLLSKVEELTANCKLSIAVGAQNISQHDEGAYTGEVSARQIKELAGFVLVGHSESRDNFAETD